MNSKATMYTEPKESLERWNNCLEQLAKSHDKQLFMQFYDHFSPRLNSWLLGLTKDSNVAEDLVQEAMLTVWRKAGQYDKSKAAASTWLFRIARNLYIDQLRRQQVRERNKPTESDGEAVDHQLNLDGSRIREAIKALPVQQAQVIYKSYFEGKSHGEIAADMDLPLGTVKSNLRLAFQKLCKAMRQAT